MIAGYEPFLSFSGKGNISLNCFSCPWLWGGCQVDIDEIHTRDPVTRDADAIKIMEAQTWLENNAALTSKTEATWRYYWEMAFNESSENWETVEIPLEFLEMPTTVLPENLDKFNETGDYKYLVNSMRAIVATNTETGEMAGFFMNVVPSLYYLQEKPFDSFNNSYLDRDEDFDGLVQFYSLEGEFINGWIYTEGAITGAIISKTDDATTEEAKSESDDDKLYMYCSKTTTYHLMDWYNEYTDEYWYTIVETTTFNEDCYLIWLPDGGEQEDIGWIDGPGGSGLCGYTIYTGVYPEGAGTINGDEYCVPGNSVTLSAVPNYPYEFSSWVDLKEQQSFSSNSTVTFTPTESMVITAVFSQLYPCEENGGYAPLLGGLQVTSTSGQGVFGGLFDAHRHGISNHRGIDISGPGGTPIFAMAGGTIVGGGLFVTGQPNRIPDPARLGKYIYPPGYTGDVNDAGNRIYILSTCGNYQYAYWHLDADNPLGINRNTGEPWAPGDEVFAGDLIGYLGLTGNAIGGDPHLHFGVRRTSDWEWINPAYKFPSFFQNPDPNTGNLTIPCE